MIFIHPLMLILCVVSALVGLAVMILLFPLPGLVANKIQSVQRIKMEKVSRHCRGLVVVSNTLHFEDRLTSSNGHRE